MYSRSLRKLAEAYLAFKSIHILKERKNLQVSNEILSEKVGRMQE